MTTLTDFIGLPYRDLEQDCWGIVTRIRREVYGLSSPDLAGQYASSEDAPTIAFIAWQQVHAGGEWTEISGDPAEGDVLLFRIGRHACHVGVYTGEGQFMHCLRGRNTTIEDLRLSGWSNRLLGVYRWKQA